MSCSSSFCFFFSLLDPQGEDAQGRANSLFSFVRLIYFTKELTQRCSRLSKPFVQPCSAYPFHQLPRARLSKQALLSLARLIFQRLDQRARPSQPFAQPCPADLSTPRSTSKAEQAICSALLGRFLNAKIHKLFVELVNEVSCSIFWPKELVPGTAFFHSKRSSTKVNE